MPDDALNRGPDGCSGDETLAALLDGLLDTPEREAIEAHALGCDACRDVLAVSARALASTDAAVEPPPSALARVRSEVARLVEPRPRRPRVHPSLRWAAAAAVILCAGAAFWVVRAGSVATSAPLSAPAPVAEPRAELVVAEVSGPIELREPDGVVFSPLAAGQRIAPGAAIRLEGEGPATIVFEGGMSLALRRDVEATLWPAPAALAVSLTAGAIAASPSPDAHSALRFDVPQGTISCTGAPLEVLVQRRGTLVIAREEGGVVCATARGEVRLEGGHHTVLFSNRPPLPPRAFPFRPRWRDRDRDRDWERGRDGGRRDGPPGGRRHGGRSRCAPPGGPELDRLLNDAEASIN